MQQNTGAEAHKFLITILRSGEVTAGSVEVLLAGSADNGRDITMYLLIATRTDGPWVGFESPCLKDE